uniref:4Fe-4S dicluster domain-containing protein n=1 Tax=Archaeoglobus fulgidus TaxID=2234 RepID=A0A7J2TH02_ARCFL
MSGQTIMNKYNRSLEFHPELCRGCGVCESVCPKMAISIRRNGKFFKAEISESCVVCGICADLCPYGAIRGEESIYKELLEEIGFEKIKVDESLCILCGLCMRECPRNAIRVVRQVDKKKLRRGNFRIKEGCIDCRLCTEVCPTKAISVYKGKPSIDYNRCIFCEMCSRICPMNVLEVRCDSCRNLEERSFALSGRVIVDSNLCSTCGICAEICPTKAIRVTKLFEGEQKWFRERCFAECTVCRDICPNFAISYRYVPDKIVEFGKRCNFCGACEKFCPGNAIEITRKLPIELEVNFRKMSRDGKMRLVKVNGNCIGCGICMSICPVGRKEILEIVDGSVTEKVTEDCTACGLCVSNCPVESIEIFEID